MEWVVAVLVSSSAIFFALWRSSSRDAAAARTKANAYQDIAAENRLAADQASDSLDKREEELRRVDEAHHVLRQELRSTAKAIASTRLDDGTLAEEWNKTMGEE